MFNTDYLAILRSLRKAVGRAMKQIGIKLNILILGAGGTARAAVFAAKQVEGDVQIFIWNRTANKVRNRLSMCSTSTS